MAPGPPDVPLCPPVSLAASTVFALEQGIPPASLWHKPGRRTPSLPRGRRPAQAGRGEPPLDAAALREFCHLRLACPMSQLRARGRRRGTCGTEPLARAPPADPPTPRHGVSTFPAAQEFSSAPWRRAASLARASSGPSSAAGRLPRWQPTLPRVPASRPRLGFPRSRAAPSLQVTRVPAVSSRALRPAPAGRLASPSCAGVLWVTSSPHPFFSLDPWAWLLGLPALHI